MITKPLTPDDPEQQISLLRAYEYLFANSTLPEQARGELVAGIMSGEVWHSVGITTEYSPAPSRPNEVVRIGLNPGEPPPPPPSPPQPPPPRITHDQPIPAAALQATIDRQPVKFSLEKSSARWRDAKTKSVFTFENIVVLRDQIIAMRPIPGQPAIVEPEGDKAKYAWDEIATEFGRRIYIGEIIPGKTSERVAAEMLGRWCGQKWGKRPAESVMREKVNTWLKAYKKSDQ